MFLLILILNYLNGYFLEEAYKTESLLKLYLIGVESKELFEGLFFLTVLVVVTLEYQF
jgi:hypothetical protein